MAKPSRTVGPRVTYTGKISLIAVKYKEIIFILFFASLITGLLKDFVLSQFPLFSYSFFK
jgi:hypothetical protein